MAQACYVSIKGSTQGEILGSCLGKETKKILVFSVDHEITVPYNEQTGIPTGSRVHTPMKISKRIDRSSPKLFQALVSREKLEMVKLEYPTFENSVEEIYYTVTLHGATLTSIQTRVQNCSTSEHAESFHIENISFSYEDIMVRYEKDGIEAEDSWVK